MNVSASVAHPRPLVNPYLCGIVAEREVRKVAKRARQPSILKKLDGATAKLADVGMIAFVPAAAMYLAAMVAGRAAYRARLAWQVDRAIDPEAWRTRPAKSTQH
jgi:hypothetical protein